MILLKNIETEKSKKYFDSLNDYFEVKEKSSEAKFFIAIDLSRILEFIPKKDGQILVDIGCGLAPYSFILEQYFQKIILIDLSNRLLRTIKERHCHFQNKLLLINMDAMNIDSMKNIYNVDLVLLTGSVLCYQPNMLSALLTKLKIILRKGGVIYGDVWNKHGLFLKNWYSNEFPNLKWQNVLQNPTDLFNFINSGITKESVNNLATNIFAYSYKELVNHIVSSGYNNYQIFGRKTLSLFLKPNEFKEQIKNSYEKLFELELNMAKQKELTLMSPKLSFLIIKE